jgi:hypothetical protein
MEPMNNLKVLPVSAVHPAFHVEDKRSPRFREWQIYRVKTQKEGVEVALSFRAWEEGNPK